MATAHPTGTAPHGRRMPGPVLAAWYCVIVAVIGVGGWSMYYVLHVLLHAPTLLALAGAVTLDAAGMIFSDWARAAVDRGRGFFFPALFMGSTLAVNAYVNYSHGATALGRPGGVMLGTFPVVLQLLFIGYALHTRLSALHQSGLLPERLPRVGVLGAILHPVISFRAIDAVVVRRLEAIGAGPRANLVTLTPADATAGVAPAHVNAAAAPAVAVSTLTPPPLTPVPPASSVAPMPTPVSVVEPAPVIAAAPSTVEVSAPLLPPLTPSAPSMAPAPTYVNVTPSVTVTGPRPVYDDRRCEVIRGLFDGGFRPVTRQMQTAVEEAGLGSIADATARILRGQIETAEPHLKRLPRAPKSA